MSWRTVTGDNWLEEKKNVFWRDGGKANNDARQCDVEDPSTLENYFLLFYETKPAQNYPSATPTKIRRFLAFWGNLYGIFLEIISVKAPGNYSGPFGSKNFSFILLGRPRSPNFMISGFWGPAIPFIH